MIITADDDFLRLAASRGDHHGVAYYKQNMRPFAQLIDHLLLIHGVLTAEEMVGHIEFP